MRTRCPWGSLCSQRIADLFKSMFGKSPISGELAAENIEKWCLAVGPLGLQDIITRRLLRF